MRPNSFYELTLQPEPFLRLTDKLVIYCGRSVSRRRDLSEVDLDMFRNAGRSRELEKKKKDWDELEYIETPMFGDVYEQEDRLEYEPEMFWGVYRRIADQFVRIFGDIDLKLLPFFYRTGYERFVFDVWSSFFTEEIWATIDFDKRFPVLVTRTVTYPDEYLITTEEIDRILMLRYKVS